MRRKHQISLKVPARLLAAFFGAFILLLPLLSPQLASAAFPHTHENDMNRRKLITLKECLGEDHLDIYNNHNDDDDVENFEDYFVDYGGEKIVVGFDRDNGNAVQTCETVMGSGIAVFARLQENREVEANFRENGAARRYFLQKATGQEGFVRLEEERGCDDDDPSGGFSTCYARNRVLNWINEINAVIGQFEPPRKAWTSQRMAGAIPLCYTVRETPSDSQQFRESTDMALPISVAGAPAKTFYFYLRDAADIQNDFKEPEGFITLNGGNFSLTNAEVGDIELNFSGQRGDGNDFNADDTDFYPLGKDLGSFTDGQLRNAFLDCAFLKNHSSFITDGVVAASATTGQFTYDLDGDGQLDEEETSAAADMALPQASTEDNANESCEAKSGVMGWIICPVILITDGALNWVDTQIERMLEVDSNTYRNDDLYESWKIIRNLAYTILIPIMLVMVISTALGFDFISAYTVKRSLPRLIAAAIFITLSWQLCTYMIELSNIVGRGTLGILTFPFGDSVSKMSLADLFGGSILTSIVALPVFAGGIALVLWFFGGTLLLMAGIAFLVLLIRQMFIVALLMVAPLAILAWIFPGNDKLWKSWWSIFSKLLLMFPLIMGIIAVGRIFAYIIDAGNQGGVLEPIMKLAAYMLPYAFIPFTFKFAGGMFATVAGIANDRSKGLFDRQKQSRANKLERTANQKMFRNAPPGGLRSRLNTAGASVMHANRAGYNPANWRRNIGGALTDNSLMQRDAMLDDKAYTFKNDDDINRAAAESWDAKSLRDNLLAADRRAIANGKAARYAGPDGAANMNRDIARVESMRKKYGNSAFRQAAWMRAVAGGTSYDGADAWAAASRIAGGNMALLSDMVGQKGLAMAAGRVDQGGAGFGDTLEVARRSREGWTDENGQHYTGEQYVQSGMADQHLTEAVYKAQGGASLVHASMKAQAVKQMAPQMVKSVSDAVRSGSQRETAQSLASLAAVYDGLNGSSPEKAKIMADNVMSQTIDVASLTPEMRQMLSGAITEKDPVTGVESSRTSITIAQAINASRGNQQFQEMRREYQSEVAGVMGQQQPQQPGGPAPTGLPGAP